MKSLSFRGHGQRKGFNPIKYPTFVNQIERETQRTLRGMQRVHDSEMQIRRDYLQGLKEKNYKELENKRGNFELAAKHAKAVKQSLDNDLKLEHENLKLKYQAELARQEPINKLKELIPKTFKLGLQAYKDQTEELNNVGKTLESRVPGLLEQAKNAGIKQLLDDSEKKLNATLLQNLEGKVSPEILEQLRNLSGRKLYGFKVGLAHRIGTTTYQHEYHKAMHVAGQDGLTPFDKYLKGDKVNFKEYNAHATNFESQFMGRYGAYLPVEFIREHAGANINAFNEEQRELVREKDRGAYETNQYNNQQSSFESDINFQGGLKGDQPLGNRVMDWININAGGDPIKKGQLRHKAVGFLAKMALDGRLGQDHLDAILDGQVEVAGKLVSIRSQWGKDFKPVQDALNKRAKLGMKASEERKEGFKAQNYLELEQVRRSKPDGRLSPSEIQEARKFLVDNGIDPNTVDHIKTYEALSDAQINKDYTEASFMDLYTQGNLTAAHLTELRYNGQVRKEWEKYIPILNDQFVKDTVKSIGQKIVTEGSKIVAPEDQSYEQKTMVALAEETLRKRILYGIRSRQYDTPAQAASAESKILALEIENGDGNWKKDGKKWLYMGKEPEVGKGSKYIRSIKKNKAFISIPGVFEDEDLAAIQNTNRDGIPPFIKSINSQYPNRHPYQIMNEILRANGKDVIKPMGVGKSYDYVSPQFLQWLTTKPSMAKTVRALTRTTELMNPEFNAMDPALNLIKDKAIVSYDEENGGHDAYTIDGKTVTATETFGKPFSEQPAAEVLNNMTKSRILKVGPYSIDSQDLNSMIEKGYVGMEEVFDESVQKRIAQIMLLQKTGKFLVEDGINVRTVIPGVGQEWVQVKGPDQVMSAQEEIEIAKKLEILKENLKNKNINLLLLRDEVVRNSLIPKVRGM